MFKVLSQQLRGTLTTAFKRYFTVEDFKDMDQHKKFFLGRYHEMKMGEGALEIISCTKIRACSLKNIAPGHFTYYCILLCLSNLVFKFDLALLKNFCHNLFTLTSGYSVYLGVCPVLLRFFL